MYGCGCCLSLASFVRLNGIPSFSSAFLKQYPTLSLDDFDRALRDVVPSGALLRTFERSRSQDIFLKLDGVVVGFACKSRVPKKWPYVDELKKELTKIPSRAYIEKYVLVLLATNMEPAMPSMGSAPSVVITSKTDDTKWKEIADLLQGKEHVEIVLVHPTAEGGLVDVVGQHGMEVIQKVQTEDEELDPKTSVPASSPPQVAPTPDAHSQQ